MTENNLLNQYREEIIASERLDNCPVGSEIELKFVENAEGFLSQEISQDSNNSPSDILKTKKKLKKLKYYKEDDKAGGMHGYPDRGLFEGIEKFQKDNDLKIDGKMKPRGETEENLVRKLWQKQKKEFENNDNKIRKNRNNHFAKVMNKAKKELELNSDSQEIIEEKPAEKTDTYRIGSNIMKKKTPEELSTAKTGFNLMAKVNKYQKKYGEDVNIAYAEDIENLNEEENLKEEKLKIRTMDAFGSGKYKASRGWRRHNGIDIVKKAGSPVRAFSDGVFERISKPYFKESRYVGLFITTTSGETERYFYVRPIIKEKTKVRKGDIIGYVENIARKYDRKGKKMTNHFHYEVKNKSGKFIDPTNRINKD
ncbi:MAG: M23 family metallopeptidase [Alphaproteobacteria bacterium]